LTDKLLDFVLERADHVGDPVFLKRELEGFPVEDLDALLSEGILRETSRATEIPRPKHLPPGGDLIVRQTSRGLYGVADEDDYFDPIPLTEDDVRQYAVSLPKLKAAVNRTNDSEDSGKQGIGEPTPWPCPETLTTGEGRFVLERKEVGDEVHWFVNGEDKGRFFSRAESHSAKIIEILYGQIGLGWVPHKTFMDACAWKKDEYFPASGDPGRMQRQLTRIRKFLGVDVKFLKDKGVCFAENVVKSK
jgi:hypothetical protein